MKRYFETLESLQEFTCNLSFHQHSVTCPHCQQQGQFVAHDYIYRKQRNGKRIIIGKRIFCSNRSSRTGCGKTLRLFLATILPAFRYTSLELLRFINSLAHSTPVQKAYSMATGTKDPRNAWRWLNKLYDKLIDYRGLFTSRPNEQSISQSRVSTKRLKLLLPTLINLLAMQVEPTVECFQLSRQQRFL